MIASSPKSAIETGTPMNMLFVAVKADEKTPACTRSILKSRTKMRLTKKQSQIERNGMIIDPASEISPSWSSFSITLEKR